MGRREHGIRDGRRAEGRTGGASRRGQLQSVSRQYAERALSTLVDQVDIELPEGIGRSEMDDHLHRFVHRLEDSELTLDDYFQASNRSGAVPRRPPPTGGDVLAEPAGSRGCSQGCGDRCHPEDVSAVIQSAAARSGDPVAYLQAFRQSGREWQSPVISQKQGVGRHPLGSESSRRRRQPDRFEIECDGSRGRDRRG